MPVSQSRNAYPDCYTLLDDALKSGKRVSFDERGPAFHLQQRLNYARLIDRRESASLFHEGDPKHGVSAYDILTFRVVEHDEMWWVYIEERKIKGEVEDIPA